MLHSGSRDAFLSLLAFTVACGGETVAEPELVTTPPPELRTGLVIAADTFTVPATDVNFTVSQFPNGGDLLADIGVSAGKFLVLSVRDQSRPGQDCIGSLFETACASIVVAENRLPGRVVVVLESGRRTYHLQSNFTLDEVPEPG
jgi:hypothetical protein